MAYRRCLLSSYSIYSRPCFCKATPQLPMTQSQYLMLSAVRSEMYSATFCPRLCLLTLLCPHKTRGTRLRKMQIHKNNLFIPSPHFLYINILIMHILSVLNNVTAHFPYFAVELSLLIACRFCCNSRRSLTPHRSSVKNMQGKERFISNVSFVTMSTEGL